MQVYGPERRGAQGLTPDQTESGNRAILALLSDAEARDHVDLVITWRDDAYEVWSQRGMVRFQRVWEGDEIRYPIVEQLGQDPLARLDPGALPTLEAEAHAAGTHDLERLFVRPDQVSYPFAHERIAQLFDSPHAPDLIVSPRAYSFGLQTGQHGALDVVQSRATLAFAGPGVRPGRPAIAARHTDVAPTLCHALGFPTIDGLDALGRPARTYLARQDGRVLDELVDPALGRPERVYVLILDGLSHTELLWNLDEVEHSIPNLRELLANAAIPAYGSVVNFPSITWPSHSTLVTGAWCGHHDIVNPAYYLRDQGEVANPQGLSIETEGYLGSGVETLYEAFGRVRGSFTAAINEPQGRGATHASLERRTIGDRARLRALTAEYRKQTSPRWEEDGFEDVVNEAFIDVRGMAQCEVLFDDPDHPVPELVVHELALTDAAGHNYGPHSDGLREALEESDARVGRVLEILRKRDLYDGTLFVVTSDHGMACQDTSLAANPARHLSRIGMKTETCEPMVWLRDLRVETRRAADGRTARLTISDADPDTNGEHRPVEGVRVEAFDHPDRRFAHATSDRSGLAALATPADVPTEQISLVLHHPDFNERHLLLTGEPIAPDPRRLYR
jgi:hypothetical protein